MTKQRKAILDAVLESRSHPTADEVYDAVRKRLPRLSLGTVYRNLDLLTEQGIIKTLGPGGQMRFDGETQNHYHIRCADCGRVDDAVIDTLKYIEAELALQSGYTVLGHELEFIGVCPDCRERKGKGL